MSRGGFSTKLSPVTDGRGLPLAAAAGAGQASDLAAAPALLDGVRVAGRRGRPRGYPDALAGDKAYSRRPMAA